MSEPGIEYDGLEYHNWHEPKPPRVVCTFKTDRFGIYQVKYTQKEDGEWKMQALPQEPHMQMLTVPDRVYVEKICRIVWRIVFDTPAAKDRFDRNL
jgi:hypothetical protein